MKELMIFLDQNTRNKSKSKFSPVLFINNVQPTTLPALVVTFLVAAEKENFFLKAQKALFSKVVQLDRSRKEVHTTYHFPFRK